MPRAGGPWKIAADVLLASAAPLLFDAPSAASWSGNSRLSPVMVVWLIALKMIMIIIMVVVVVVMMMMMMMMSRIANDVAGCAADG
eukprot:1249928-Rhodomonas_salina.1